MYCHYCGVIFEQREQYFLCDICDSVLCSECKNICDMCHRTICGKCKTVHNLLVKGEITQSKECKTCDYDWKKDMEVCVHCDEFADCIKCDAILCLCAKPCEICKLYFCVNCKHTHKNV
jgi:hypothetical protein